MTEPPGVADPPAGEPAATAPAAPGQADERGAGSEATVPRRRRRWLVAGATALAVVVAFLGVTAVTGLPGPGPLRRYPAADLQRLAEAVEADAGPIRTPDDCWRTLSDDDGPVRSIARVDHLRSRVVVRAWASDDGILDPVTANRVAARLQGVVRAHPDLDWGMLVVEPSPDGWSTHVDCARVVRNPITGF